MLYSLQFVICSPHAGLFRTASPAARKQRSLKIMKEKLQRIDELKKERNAVIMAHYYVPDEVQKAADFIGDSFFLSKKATEVEADTIVLCGVSFMGESAKILNPDKTVLLPDASADCPMAHMAAADRIAAVRQRYDDLAVVCYVNSTAELKALSDVCVTSSNALKIVRNLPDKNIYFIPDQNLAHFIADKLPEKNFIFNDGFCYVHNDVTGDEVAALKKKHPDAPVLAHPESKPEVLQLADYAGSTSGIIDYAAGSDRDEFIIITESGVLCELKKQNPGKRFYTTEKPQICAGMKAVSLEGIIRALEDDYTGITMDESLISDALRPMGKMLELSR